MNTATETLTASEVAELVEAAGLDYAAELIGLGEILTASGLDYTEGGSMHYSKGAYTFDRGGLAYILLNDSARKLLERSAFSGWLDECNTVIDLILDGPAVVLVVAGSALVHVDSNALDGCATLPARCFDFTRSAGLVSIDLGAKVIGFTVTE